MKTITADFKPLSYFEWIDYIKQQVKGEYKLQDGFKYSNNTKCVYNRNGSLYGINGLLEDDTVYFDTFADCQCNGSKIIEVIENGDQFVGFEDCHECDYNGQVLIEETLKLK